MHGFSLVVPLPYNNLSGGLSVSFPNRQTSSFFWGASAHIIHNSPISSFRLSLAGVLREQRYKYSTKQSLPWTFLINFSLQKATFGPVCSLCGPRKASARTSAGIAGASHTYPVCTPFTSILTLPSPIGKYFLKKKKSNESEFIHLL